MRRATQEPSDGLSMVGRELSLRAETSHRVIMVGAGMGGLIAVCERLRAGPDPLILRDPRVVGGGQSRNGPRGRGVETVSSKFSEDR
jgi:hypothetical protein